MDVVMPGDTGRCKICGEKMYEGRYWHMRDEHAIMEDYTSFKKLTVTDLVEALEKAEKRISELEELLKEAMDWTERPVQTQEDAAMYLYWHSKCVAAVGES